jgi:hypothetical protein
MDEQSSAVCRAYPISLQMSGWSDGNRKLNDSKPPSAMHAHACAVNMLYSVEPLTAGFLPVFPDARGANLLAMSLTPLSAFFAATFADCAACSAFCSAAASTATWWGAIVSDAHRAVLLDAYMRKHILYHRAGSCCYSHARTMQCCLVMYWRNFVCYIRSGVALGRLSTTGHSVHDMLPEFARGSTTSHIINMYEAHLPQPIARHRAQHCIVDVSASFRIPGASIVRIENPRELATSSCDFGIPSSWCR